MEQYIPLNQLINRLKITYTENHYQYLFHLWAKAEGLDFASVPMGLHHVVCHGFTINQVIQTVCLFFKASH